MKVVVDASVIVDYLRRGDVPGVLYLEILRQRVEVVISTVTVAELYAGGSAQKGGKQRDNLDLVMTGAEIAGVDLAMAKAVGEMRSKYRLGLADAFIAALALSENLPVATLDTSDFSPVEGLQVYAMLAS